MRDYFTSKGIKYDLVWLYPKSHDMFWVYIKTAELKKAMQEWSLKKMIALFYEYGRNLVALAVKGLMEQRYNKNIRLSI